MSNLLLKMTLRKIDNYRSWNRPHYALNLNDLVLKTGENAVVEIYKKLKVLPTGIYLTNRSELKLEYYYFLESVVTFVLTSRFFKIYKGLDVKAIYALKEFDQILKRFCSLTPEESIDAVLKK